MLNILPIKLRGNGIWYFWQTVIIRKLMGICGSEILFSEGKISVL
jgi:hypothetical protein